MARQWTYKIRAHPPPPDPGWSTTIVTAGSQTVNFQYFGGVSRIILRNRYQSQVWYDGAPIPLWGSPDIINIEAIGDGHILATTIILY